MDCEYIVVLSQYLVFVKTLLIISAFREYTSAETRVCHKTPTEVFLKCA